jgi:Ca2+-binding EF-hand superfamily protein
MRPGMGRGQWSPPSFQRFDTDGDGEISQSELDQARAERRSQRAQQGYRLRGAASAPSFDDIDQDGDGQISPAEFRDFPHGQHRQPMGWR